MEHYEVYSFPEGRYLASVGFKTFKTWLKDKELLPYFKTFRLEQDGDASA